MFLSACPGGKGSVVWVWCVFNIGREQKLVLGNVCTMGKLNCLTLLAVFIFLGKDVYLLWFHEWSCNQVRADFFCYCTLIFPLHASACMPQEKNICIPSLGFVRRSQVDNH